MSNTNLTPEELATYEWQMWVPGFAAAGQQKLRDACVLVSRVGGVGGLVAYQLAAAGIGRLILAHAGNIKHSDLNRQLLMTYDQLGSSRVESASKRLRELNPRLVVDAVPENISRENAADLVKECDVVVDCAPLFPERFAMHEAAYAQGKPMVECAMYELEAQITTLVPGKTPCLRCLYPNEPESWTRQFPVFGAVSGTVACMAAMEAIKLISGLGTPLLNEMLKFDLRDMSFHKLKILKREDCSFCSG